VRCRGDAARSVLAKVRGHVYAHSHTVATKVAVEPGTHNLAGWDKFFVLPHVPCKWRHKLGIFWIPRLIIAVKLLLSTIIAPILIYLLIFEYVRPLTE
jgi:hypothetical protein